MNVYNTCRNYIAYANFSLFIQMKAMKSRSILEKVKCILTSYLISAAYRRKVRDTQSVRTLRKIHLRNVMFYLTQTCVTVYKEIVLEMFHVLWRRTKSQVPPLEKSHDDLEIDRGSNNICLLNRCICSTFSWRTNISINVIGDWNIQQTFLQKPNAAVTPGSLQCSLKYAACA